jgi:hypothetical protein
MVKGEAVGIQGAEVRHEWWSHVPIEDRGSEAMEVTHNG